MAVPSYTSAYSGSWLSQARRDTLEYQTARVWGTGVHPIHGTRMGVGRNDATAPDATAADVAVAEIGTEDYGYNPEDIAGLDYFASPVLATEGMPFEPDQWPSPEENIRHDIPFNGQRPLGAGGRFKAFIHSVRTGARNDNQWRGISTQIPVETVNEGWLNKPSTGMDIGDPADSEPSDNSQIFVMTSQVQRNKTLDNDRAMMRGTDQAREAIPSRIVPMKVKEYSEGKRHYDMFPFQIEDIPRPFSYRTAGTGPRYYLLPNEQWQVTALQRTPPPDPSMGTVDSELSSDYGYTTEDGGFY